MVHHQIRTLGMQPPAYRRTDTLGAAGYQCHFACQFFTHVIVT